VQVSVINAFVGVKLRAAKCTRVPLGPAKFHMNRCHKSPLWGEKRIFGLWVNLIPAVCRFAASCR